MKPRREIAIYGRGGVGKSTTASNLAVALEERGERVLLVGCDYKADATQGLLGPQKATPLLEEWRRVGISRDSLPDLILKGYGDVWCLEVGGPRTGAGCAGKGVVVALEFLARYHIADQLGVSFTVYDSLEPICGGLAQPMRQGYAREVYLVTSAELSSLHATSIIAQAVRRLTSQGSLVGLGGVIHNQRGLPGEKEIAEEYSRLLGVPLLAHIPYSPLIHEAELQRKTVVELFPRSEAAAAYHSLAQAVQGQKTYQTPRPLEREDLITLLLLNR